MGCMRFMSVDWAFKLQLILNSIYPKLNTSMPMALLLCVQLSKYTASCIFSLRELGINVPVHMMYCYILFCFPFKDYVLYKAEDKQKESCL